MKFTLTTITQSGARLGSLNDFIRISGASFETPFLLLHTRGGSVPFLSHDLMQMVTTERQVSQMPLVTLVDHCPNIEAFGKGVASFSGLQDYLSYVTVQDSGTSTPEGYHEKNTISLWTRGGRKLIDANTFMSCMEALKPDLFQMLSDGDTTAKSSGKRVTKSVDATLKFAAHCTELKERSEVLRETPLLASIVGGFSVKERLRCIEGLKAFDTAGYVIDGFHTNGESATNLAWADVEPVLVETLAALPNNKPRFFHGAVTPQTLLRLVFKGIDVFDATFPWQVAERGGALVFPNSLGGAGESVDETLPTVKEAIAKSNEGNGKTEAKEQTPSRLYEIDLKDKIYYNDSRPLLANCSCYSCRKYARCYVHHLLSTSELLGPMLLMMHNLHHYIQFFRNIRSALKEDQLEELQNKLELFIASRR